MRVFISTGVVAPERSNKHDRGKEEYIRDYCHINYEKVKTLQHILPVYVLTHENSTPHC